MISGNMPKTHLPEKCTLSRKDFNIFITGTNCPEYRLSVSMNASSLLSSIDEEEYIKMLMQGEHPGNNFIYSLLFLGFAGQ